MLSDGAGVVEAMGPEAEGVSVGDRVFIVPGISCGICAYCKAGADNQCDSFEILGAKRSGTYAEYVTVPDQNVSPLPENISFETGAAFPLAYLTAWHMLQTRAKLLKSETLLVIGASAGVGIAAIQIGKLIGAKVWAVSTSAEKISAIKKAGADEVFLMENGADFSTWVREKTHKHGVNVVFEHVGPATFEMSLKSLAKCGRLVTCGATTGPTTQIDLRYVFSRDLSILGARMGTQKELQAVASAVFSGKISPLIHKTFEASQVSLAHQTMEDKKQTGKILLKF
jgi:NADPH2:quinone reductase